MFISRSLVSDLKSAFVSGIEDRGGRMPSYGWTPRGNFSITTEESRDPSRMWNGGEYEYYAVYNPRRGRGWSQCSCDFWQPEGWDQEDRFPPMSRRKFMLHVRVARKLAVRKYREIEARREPAPPRLRGW